MQTNHLPQQQRFVALLKMLVPAQVNLARDLSELLDLSNDGVYRRLRAETAFSLDEAVRICLHYSIPLEALNSEIPDVVTFQFTQLDNSQERFQTYFEQLGEQLKWIGKAPDAHIYYAAEDIPLFYHFGFPALTAFKLFYWRKSILSVSDLEQSKFSSTHQLNPELPELLYSRFAAVRTTEIWTEETLMSTLQQVRFYWDAGFFATTEDALLVLNEMSKLMERIARQAEIAQKIDFHGASTGVPYTLYLCDLMIGNNSIYVHTGSSAITFIGYNTFNAIHTRNQAFNTQHKQWMENLSGKSIQISGMAEKIRNQFFKSQLRKIEQLRLYIETDSGR